MRYDEIHFVQGGVTAPRGFTANAVLCRIKESRETDDLALVFSERRCAAAGLFTQNRVQAECVKLTKRHLADGKAQAIIANSGNANACTGSEGAENARRMARLAADALGIECADVVVCSTGVIGQQLPIEKIEAKVGELAAGLAKERHEAAARAIMTTDTHCKECAVQFALGGKIVTIGAMCKGSGMIHINMGTMLGFITTDCAISSDMLARALRESADETYNCVSIDGDTSTNDTLAILANGMAENAEITDEGNDYDMFLAALNKLNTVMAKKIAADGEGATRLIECTVTGAKSAKVARALAKSVISSNLVKAAMFGKDANWGRILCALGYAGEEFSPETCSVYFSSDAHAARYFTPCENDVVSGSQKIQVFDKGVPLDFDETLAALVLGAEAVEILVTLEDGAGRGRAWGCDLTYDYVKINGDYRT